MKITIQTIPHENQPYPTVGYWEFIAPDHLMVNVSDMGNADYAFLVGIHEAIEAWLCGKRGIDGQIVTDFDVEYEKNRPEGDESEPGDESKAPYYAEHQIATGIERILAAQLGVDWNSYADEVESL